MEEKNEKKTIKKRWPSLLGFSRNTYEEEDEYEMSVLPLLMFKSKAVKIALVSFELGCIRRI